MTASASAVVVRAHGKINLSLEVLGRRPDGFHEIRTILARIALHDTIELRHAAGLGVRWPPGTMAPQDDLIRRAAQRLRDFASSPLGARISVTKRLPIAAGIAGGSSDAAATLLGLNRLWSLGLSPQVLAGIAAELGSDVPFFLRRSPALTAGRGEALQPLRTQLACWIVVVTPRWNADRKTARLYGLLDSASFSDGSRVQHLADSLSARQPLTTAALPNAFERLIDTVFPEWSALRRSLESATGRPFWLTGAGPALYALADTRSEAVATQRRAGAVGQPCLVTRLVAAPPRVLKVSC